MFVKPLMTSISLLICNQNTTETSSHDVSPIEQTILDGTTIIDRDDFQQETGNIDTSVYSAEVSINGGSDNEISKAETSRIQAGHVRTTSTVKKALSFKPVSVNKTFLAAKGATIAAASKPGEKGPTASASAQSGPSLNSAPRPRLVAKSGSGLRDSAPRGAVIANGSKTGAAPDASAVWNKNRRM